MTFSVFKYNAVYELRVIVFIDEGLRPKSI